MHRQAIPIRDLNLEINQPQQQIKNRPAPKTIKTKNAKKDEEQKQTQQIDMRLSQKEIFEQMGLEPITIESSKKQKQALIISSLKDQPIVKSQLWDENKKLLQIERRDIQNQIDQFKPFDEQQEEQFEENEDQLENIQSQINFHYERIQKLENDFMKEDVKDSYQPDDNVWERVKQLKEYRKQLKQEQLKEREQYEIDQKKQREVKVVVKENKQIQKSKEREKDPFIQKQIEDFLKEKEAKKNQPRQKMQIDIKPKSPERQIFEHNYEEYKKDKEIQKQMELKSKQLQQQDFERIKLKDKPEVEIQINQRAIQQVKTLDELHKLQIQVFKDEQIDKLDIQSKKAIFNSLINDKKSEKQIQNEKNENFVLKFSFQQIDRDQAGFVSKGEVQEFLLINKDIQIIFDLDLKVIEQEISAFQTHRKGMMNFEEFSQFIRKIHQDRKQKVELFKQNASLMEQNQEEQMIQRYWNPIKEIFKILDYQQTGVYNRNDLVRAIRNDLSKKNTKVLSLPISLQQGSPSVNQVLEKILADYRQSRNKREIELMSLNQLWEYFQKSMPYEEIRLMQARIILAHFGPGSIAQEGYYNKIKNRCILEHEQIQELLEIFMKLDTNCELIIEKQLLIDRIKEQIDVSINAVRIDKISKQYTLEQVLNQLQQTIKQTDGYHDSQFISLQQFTEYLTNFNPAQPKLPNLYFINESENPPEGEYLTLHINSIYLQIIQDVFDMIPRVFAHYVLKEEFIATAKNDPQSKCLLQQIGRVENKKQETINSILNKISKIDIDFLQWIDVIYMFSEKGDILKEDYDNKLTVKPQQLRARKLYQQVVKGPEMEQEEEYDEVENLSFDDMQLKKMSSKYDQFQKQVRQSKSTKRLTVPKEPNFRPKKMTIRQKKLEEMVQAIEEKELFELNNKFKANPMPIDMFMPQNHQSKFYKTQQQPFNAPTFYQKDVGKFLERRQYAEEREKQKEKTVQFKAKEVPIECNLELLKQKEIQEKQRKIEQKEKRKQELIQNTNAPKGLLEDEQRRKQKKEQTKNLKPHEVDPECKFAPKLNKNFVSKRKEEEKQQKIVVPDYSYMDDDNQRKKKKESPRQSSKKISDQQQEIQEEDQDLNQQQQDIQNNPEQEQEDKQEEQVDENQNQNQFEQNDENQEQEQGQYQVEEDNQEVKIPPNQKSNQSEKSVQQSQKQPSIAQQSEINQSKKQPSKPSSQKKIEPPKEKKEKPKPLSTADREQLRLKQEKEKKKKDFEKMQSKLDPSYQQKLKDMEERVQKKPLLVGQKQHGSSTLDKYRVMADQEKKKQGESIQQTEEQMEKTQQNNILNFINDIEEVQQENQQDDYQEDNE